MSAAKILREAARLLRTEEVLWGREFFITADGCRCTLGAIALAADPGDGDGDPNWVTPEVRGDAVAAVKVLVDFLVHQADAIECFTDEGRDETETVGGWNDEPERTIDDVVRALEAAADLAERAAAA